MPLWTFPVISLYFHLLHVVLFCDVYSFCPSCPCFLSLCLRFRCISSLSVEGPSTLHLLSVAIPLFGSRIYVFKLPLYCHTSFLAKLLRERVKWLADAGNTGQNQRECSWSPALYWHVDGKLSLGVTCREISCDVYFNVLVLHQEYQCMLPVCQGVPPWRENMDVVTGN